MNIYDTANKLAQEIKTSEEYINYKNAKNMVSKEYIWVYPPGIPLITPGEIIDDDIIRKIREFGKAGIEVRTTFNKFPKIEIIKS